MSEQHETYPNIFEAFVLIVVLILIELLVSAGMFDSDFLTDADWVDVSGLITVVGNGVLFVGLMAYKRMSYRQLFHPTNNSVAATLSLVTVPILLLAPGLMLAAGTINSLVVWLLPMSAEDQAMFADVMSSSSLALFFACVAAPVLEEMLFRGVILRSFLHQYSRTKAILWSSAIFGIAHLNVYQLATAFAIGIVAGWLYERCRSLWPCILLHATYNGTVTWLYAQQGLEDPSIEDTWAYSAIAFMAAIIGGLMLLRLLHRDKPRVSR
ncbi:MAG: CPBP family intramembrane glutamic endopeptidase [Povalibacter sp.]